MFESPQRLKKSLNELKEYCGGRREIVVSRELTKKFEENIGNNIDDTLSFFEDKEVIGEITLVIKGIEAEKKENEFNKLEIKNDLYELTNAGLSLSAASKYLARRNNIKKNSIYDLYLSPNIKKENVCDH